MLKRLIFEKEETIESNNLSKMHALMELLQIHIKQQNFFDAYLLLQKILKENSSDEFD